MTQLMLFYLSSGIVLGLTAGVAPGPLFLNPHPYLFWITVGIPFILKSWASGPWRALIWLAFFYIMLVGSKMAVAMVIGRSRNWFFQRGYVWLNRGLGFVLLFFAIILAKDGISMMGLWPR